MISFWNLSNKKSPQYSRTLLGILADLNNAVVWMVSTRSALSKFSSPCTNPLVTAPRAPIRIGIIVTFMFHRLFNSLASSRYLSLFSHSFNFTSWSSGTTKSTVLKVPLYLVDYYKILSSGRDLVIRLYVKIPEELVRLILLDRFWVVHIPFVRMDKIQFPAQFLVDNLAHPHTGVC